MMSICRRADPSLSRSWARSSGCVYLQEALGLTSKSCLVTVLDAAAENLQQARRGTEATTIRSLASKVKNSAYATIKPALRQTVLDTVRRVMARACCCPAPQT